MTESIRVEGLREFSRDVTRANAALGKELGQVNKRIGRLIIDRWLRPRSVPEAVGRGAGAAIRPSATKREVLLRVGGKHRARHLPYMQWGKRPVGSPSAAPARPYIKKSAMDHRDEITDLWLQSVMEAMDPAFHQTTP